MPLRPAYLGAERAPALLSFPDDPPRSVVIVLPGGGVHYDKRWAAEWLPLDDLPVLRAYVDLPLHGERLAEDLRDRFRHDRVKRFFGPSILGMVRELPSILDDLLELSGDPTIEEVGLCGWSIGGLAAFLSALTDPRITALAGFGIPGGGIDHLRLDHVPAEDEERLSLLEELDLFRHAAGLVPRPVLLLHGARDTWVHPESSRRLHQQLQALYAGNQERLRYAEFAGTPHDPLQGPPEERASIRSVIRDWFVRHLLQAPAPRRPSPPDRSG